MQIRLGKNISSQQASQLEEASRDRMNAVRGLYSVANDEDIINGREELHPDWLGIYETNAETLSRMLMPEGQEQVSNFFGSADPYDNEIRSLNLEGLDIAFLLGAGASKPEPSGIPVTNELLTHLLSRAKRISREEVERVAVYCEEQDIKNIEDLLTAAQVATFCARNPNVLSLTEFLLYRDARHGSPSRSRGRTSYENYSVALLQDTLQVLFGMLSGIMLPAKPNAAHEAVAEYARAHPRSRIITTNYDCCMDLALGKPGADFSYQVEFVNDENGKASDDTTTRLIKLHGSLNWFYCETCQTVQLTNIARLVGDYSTDAASFPVIGICPKCSGQRRGLAVPPLAMKFDFFPPLTPLIEEAALAFAAADAIVVVGFSFADADLYITRMLSKAMQAKPDQKLIIVDPNAEIVTKIKRRFGALIPDFDVRRVLKARKDCTIAVPTILDKVQHALSPELGDEDEVPPQVTVPSRKKTPAAKS